MADPRRDEQLARSLLRSAQQIGARSYAKWVGGAVLADAARDADMKGFEHDDEAKAIIDGVLISNGLLEEEMNPHGDSKDLRRRRFRLTTMGWKLLMKDPEVPPVPGVADPRLEG